MPYIDILINLINGTGGEYKAGVGLDDTKFCTILFGIFNVNCLISCFTNSQMLRPNCHMKRAYLNKDKFGDELPTQWRF